MHIPSEPNETEKRLYLDHGQRLLTFFSFLGFLGASVSSWEYFSSDVRLYAFFPFLAFTIAYYLVSMTIQGFGKEFDHPSHEKVVKNWKPNDRHSVDVFLPTCGEDISIIKNTWGGVREMQRNYKGKVSVYCLDDAANPEVQQLAEQFQFTYLSREDRGFYKKAGNLLHGYKNSSSEFVAIFDADFRPRADFLHELLPYFDKHPEVGIVQTPQYFDVHAGQNWLERGAGAVQEYFYRSVQQNRHIHGGAICVGTNAVYRRIALDSNNGPTLIEHSEDVHTGFDLKKNGWELVYLPLVLAKGVCPNDIRSFFRQQYRWCKGSMSLLSSKKFWQAPLSLRQRICFTSGFFYYIHTAVATLVLPLIPLSLLYLVPEQAKLTNYLILLPMFIYAGVIFPLWHKTKYRWETLGIKMIYGWAHLFAIVDTILRKGMEWHPTGSKNNKSLHFSVFQFLLCAFSIPVSILWVGGAVYYMATWDVLDFLPTLITGLIYAATVGAICLTAFEVGTKKSGIHTIVARA